MITVRGREEHENSSASATVTAALSSDDNGTRVAVTSDLLTSGRAAQLSRSLFTDVTATLIGEFAHRLEHMIHGERVGDTNGTMASEKSSSSVPVHTENAASRSTAARVYEEPDNSLDMDAPLLMPLLRKVAAPARSVLAAGLIGIWMGATRRKSVADAVDDVSSCGMRAPTG